MHIEVDIQQANLFSEPTGTTNHQHYNTIGNTALPYHKISVALHDISLQNITVLTHARYMREYSGPKHVANSLLAHTVLLILTVRLSTVNESIFKLFTCTVR
jgi:hypothetical protein